MPGHVGKVTLPDSLTMPRVALSNQFTETLSRARDGANAGAELPGPGPHNSRGSSIQNDPRLFLFVSKMLVVGQLVKIDVAPISK